MTRIDRNMQVGEALFILGHQDLSDVDALMRDICARAEKLEETRYEWSKDILKLEAVKDYLNELKITGNFADSKKIMGMLEAEG